MASIKYKNDDGSFIKLPIIQGAPYELPIASETTLGGVKIPTVGPIRNLADGNLYINYGTGLEVDEVTGKLQANAVRVVTEAGTNVDVDYWETGTYFFSFANKPTNLPIERGGYLEVSLASDAYIMQKFYPYETEEVYIRHRIDDVWEDWKNLSAPVAQNSNSTSTTDTYSCDYINNNVGKPIVTSLYIGSSAGNGNNTNVGDVITLSEPIINFDFILLRIGTRVHEWTSKYELLYRPALHISESSGSRFVIPYSCYQETNIQTMELGFTSTTTLKIYLNSLPNTGGNGGYVSRIYGIKF